MTGYDANTIDDIGSGLSTWRVWTMLASNDIKQRYRRSSLGQFWLTLSMAILVLGMGVLPIRTYSSGMMLRPAFGVSTAVKPDIIILDEIICAGDAAFVEKARVRITGLIKDAAILVLATHDDATLRQFCTVAVWMDSGRVAAAGDIESVLAQYYSEVDKG